VHVFPYDPLTPLPAPEYVELEREHALTALARLADALIDETEVTLHVETNPSPVRGLHDAAETLGASLLVTGASHRGRFGRVIPGGVGERLLHSAPCAVAIAPRGYRRAERGLRHIGVAFADTREGREALSAATIMALLGGARLSVYTVVEPDPPIAPATMAPAWLAPAGFDEHRRELARAITEQAVAGAPAGVVDGIAILEGDAAEALAEASAGVDLLVCGSRGHGPLHTVLLGGVSATLAHSCSCPLLILPRDRAAASAAQTSEAMARDVER
jgi:nucleotide-binding universal stress UspA family protein